jgi:hypothetical protein
MKTSNKILWISSSSLIGVALVLLIALRISLGTDLDHEKQNDTEKTWVSRHLPLSDFTDVELGGRWEVELRRNDAEQVIVEGPEDMIDGLYARKEGKKLLLERKKRRSEKNKLKASIAMPSLDYLRLNGVIDLNMNGFETSSLSIRTKGVTSIQGTKNSIQDLHLRGEGVSKLDLRKSPVTNADLDYEGVFKIRLSMAGGELTGSIEGVGKVLYDGQISRKAISKEGPCKVVRE